MGLWSWIARNWFDLLQTLGIIGGLFFTAYTVRMDKRTREIGNLIAIKQEYRGIWKELYEHPELSRILEKKPDLEGKAITAEEGLLIKLLLLHLDTVRRATEAGMFVEIEGLRKDIREFLTLPIPRAVWN